MASGGSASAVLAKTTGTELVLVDIGSRCDPLRETPTYRCRNVRAGVCELVPGAALTADEFRAAFVVGQNEAERAAKDGIKVVAANGWFAARPSGTEAIYKIYAESFSGEKHLALIEAEAQTVANQAFASASPATMNLELQETK